MQINRLAVDLYSGDRVTSFADAYAAGVRLIILKATEGGNYTDPTYASRRDAALAAGMMVGTYHFGTGSPVGSQLDHFAAVVGNDPRVRMILDWENPAMSNDAARAFLDAADARFGRPTILYSYAAFLEDRLATKPDPFFGAHPLWIAAYRSTPPPLQASWSRYLLWQFTDGKNGPEPHGCPGIPGNDAGELDSSHFDGDEAALRAAWLGDAAAKPAPATLDIIEAVERLQTALNDLGASPVLNVDGDRGAKTNAALRALADRP